MGSPLGPTFANIFLGYHEQIRLKIVLVNLNLSFIKDMLMRLLFRSKNHINKFRCYLNRQHHNISLHLR